MHHTFINESAIIYFCVFLYKNFEHTERKHTHFSTIFTVYLCLLRSTAAKKTLYASKFWILVLGKRVHVYKYGNSKWKWKIKMKTTTTHKTNNEKPKNEEKKWNESLSWDQNIKFVRVSLYVDCESFFAFSEFEFVGSVNRNVCMSPYVYIYIWNVWIDGDGSSSSSSSNVCVYTEWIWIYVMLLCIACSLIIIIWITKRIRIWTGHCLFALSLHFLDVIEHNSAYILVVYKSILLILFPILGYTCKRIVRAICSSVCVWVFYDISYTLCMGNALVGWLDGKLFR